MSVLLRLRMAAGERLGKKVGLDHGNGNEEDLGPFKQWRMPLWVPVVLGVEKGP